MFARLDVIKKFHPHPLTFLSFYFGGIFFIAVGSFTMLKIIIPVGILILVAGELSRRAETFYLLEKGVERGYKLFSTSVEFVEYEKIQEVEVYQSLLERIFGIGTLKFDTSGTDKVEMYFYGTPDPYGVEKLIRAKMTG